jgi:hypothetical protein
MQALPLIVNRPGSPGPEPTRKQMPEESLDLLEEELEAMM